MNASFLVLDLSSFGAAAAARDVATGGLRMALSAGARRLATTEAVALARSEGGQVARKSCEMLARAVEEEGPKLLSEIPNRVINGANHIFGPKSLLKHKLSAVLESFRGDATAAFYSLENAAQELANRGVLKSGIFQTTVDIGGGVIVTVRGAVIDGVAYLSTAFIP